MTDHANELRRHARKIAHPAGDVPAVMLRAANEIERLQSVIASPHNMTRDGGSRMTPTETTTILRQFNEWRRLEDDALIYSDSEIGEAIDAAVEMIERLELAEKERDELQAKIEQMEKQEPAGYGVRYVEPANGEDDWDSIWMHRAFAEDHIKDFTQAYADMGEPVGAITVVPLYTLPGAKGE